MSLGNQRANQSNLTVGGPWSIDTAAEATAELGAPQTPTMTNGHIAGSNLSFYSDPSNIVHLRGTIDVRSATAAAAFTLPVAYRPFDVTTFPLVVGIPSPGPSIIPIMGFVTISATGVVSFSHFGTVAGVTLSSAISLEGISFPAAFVQPTLTQTLGTLPTNANGALTLGVWLNADTGLALFPNASWSGSVSMDIDWWGNAIMNGGLVTTSIARAAGASILPHHRAGIARQSFACYATGVTSGAGFVIVDAREDGNLTCQHALNAGATIDLSPVRITTSTTFAASVGAGAANAELDRNMFQPGPWQALGLAGNTAVANYATPGWRFDGKGRIELRGCINITASSVATYSGFPAPPADLQFQAAATNGMNLSPPRLPQVSVGAVGGSIFVGIGTNTPPPAGSTVCLDGISWRML